MTQQSHNNTPVTVSTLPGASIAVWWFALFAISFVLYAATANRGVQWQDSGHHILRIVTGESVNPLGLALSHPLHHWLGRLAVWFDLFDPCLAITLVSSLAAACAIANTFGCVQTLTGRLPAALLAAASLGLAHTFWQLATLAESYTLTAALLAGECWSLAAFARSRRPGFLGLAFLLNGFGVANHMLAALTTPVLAAVLLIALFQGRMALRHAALASALWLAGSLPYLGLVVAEAVRSGDLAGTIHSALFGLSYSDAVLNLTPSLRQLGIGMGFAALSFPNLLLPAALYGFVKARRYGVATLARRSLTAGLVIHLVFAFRYDIVDQHTFFLPLYVLLTMFGGIGFAAVLNRQSASSRRIAVIAAVVLLVLTPGWYALAPSIARGPRIARLLDAFGWAPRHRPYRDEYVYRLIPWSIAERSAQRMSQEAVELAGDRGLILVEDRMAEFAVRYQIHRLKPNGVRILPNASLEGMLDALRHSRPVVLVPRSVEKPRTDPPLGAWRRVGDLYLLDVLPHAP